MTRPDSILSAQDRAERRCWLLASLIAFAAGLALILFNGCATTAPKPAPTEPVASRSPMLDAKRLPLRRGLEMDAATGTIMHLRFWGRGWFYYLQARDTMDGCWQQVGPVFTSRDELCPPCLPYSQFNEVADNIVATQPARFYRVVSDTNYWTAWRT